MNSKPPFLSCLFLLLTGGLYGLIWLYLLGKDLNRARGEEAISEAEVLTPYKNYLLLYLGSFVVIFFVFILGMGGVNPLFFNMFIFMVVLFFLMLTYASFKLLFAVARGIREGGVESVASPIVLVLLTFLFGVSLPYLQVKLNRLTLRPLHD